MSEKLKIAALNQIAAALDRLKPVGAVKPNFNKAEAFVWNGTEAGLHAVIVLCKHLHHSESRMRDNKMLSLGIGGWISKQHVGHWIAGKDSAESEIAIRGWAIRIFAVPTKRVDAAKLELVLPLNHRHVVGDRTRDRSTGTPRRRGR